MNEGVFVYLVDLPRYIHEMVVPCAEGYTVYIDEKLDMAHRQQAYEHAMHHIENDDFQRTDVQQIEAEAHQTEEKLYAPVMTPEQKRWEERRQKALRRIKRKRKKLQRQLKDYDQFVEYRCSVDRDYADMMKIF